MLGTGGFGSVVKALLTDGNGNIRAVAVKTALTPAPDNSESDEEEASASDQASEGCDTNSTPMPGQASGGPPRPPAHVYADLAVDLPGDAPVPAIPVGAPTLQVPAPAARAAAVAANKSRYSRASPTAVLSAAAAASSQDEMLRAQAAADSSESASSSEPAASTAAGDAADAAYAGADHIVHLQAPPAPDDQDIGCSVAAAPSSCARAMIGIDMSRQVLAGSYAARALRLEGIFMSLLRGCPHVLPSLGWRGDECRRLVLPLARGGSLFDRLW